MSTSTPSTGPDDALHPADQIYLQLLRLFGTSGNELFAMEWPARALDEVTYAYPVSSVYSGLMKPQTVAEAEFRLSNDLLDLGTIVAGPNGDQLSVVAEAALNQLVPAYTPVSQAFQADREVLRAWLLEPTSAQYVDDDNNPQTVSGARIEVYDLLNERYLKGVSAWEDEKATKLAEAEGAADQAVALEQYAKWLADEAASREATLESKFADLVVKGYYHEVRAAVASLDIEAPGEALENAKARMRASGVSSLDESETVYPVTFSPQDWAKGLSTNFQPEDLLLSPDLIQQEIVEKQQQITNLQSQATYLQSTHTGDEQKLHDAVAAAQDALDSALTDLTDQYGANLITAVRTYYAAAGNKATSGGADKAIADANAQDGSGKKTDPLTPEQWQALQKGFDDVNQKQQTLTSAGAKLVQLQAAEQAAKTTDASQLIATITAQVGELQQQIQRLQSMLFSPQGQATLQSRATVDAEGKVTYAPAPDPDPAKPLPAPMPAPGEWTDFVFEFDSSKHSSSSAHTESASQTSWDVDLFFGSASGSSSSAQSEAWAKTSAKAASFQLAFRAMKVTIDRGGWFDPSLFARTSEMYNLGKPDKSNYDPVSYGAAVDSNGAPLDLATLLGSSAGATTVKAALQGLIDGPDHKKPSVLPAYPIAFIVVKDVTIHITSMDQQTANNAASATSSSSYSGGIFCFSVSGSSSSSSASQSAYSAASNTGLTIKIPGPQILGWFMEYVAADESVSYQKMPDHYLPTDLHPGPLLNGRDSSAAPTEPRQPALAPQPSQEAVALEQAVREEVIAVLNDDAADGASVTRP